MWQRLLPPTATGAEEVGDAAVVGGFDGGAVWTGGLTVAVVRGAVVVGAGGPLLLGVALLVVDLVWSGVPWACSCALPQPAAASTMAAQPIKIVVRIAASSILPVQMHTHAAWFTPIRSNGARSTPRSMLAIDVDHDLY